MPAACFAAAAPKSDNITMLRIIITEAGSDLRMKTNERNTGILLVAVSAAAFGLMPVFAKMAYAAGTGTYTLLFLRFLTASAFMFLLMRIRALPLP